MKNALHKLKSSRGFTLGETLICVLILLMVVGVVGGAIPAASSAYTKAVDAANAQVLLSTAMTVLRDELSNASEVKDPVVNNTAKTVTLEYRSGTTGRMTKIVSSPEGVSIWEYGVESLARNEDGSVKLDAYGKAVIDVAYSSDYMRILVSKKAATRGLSLSYSGVSKADHVITIGSLNVMREGGTAPSAEKKDFSIRTLG